MYKKFRNYKLYILNSTLGFTLIELLVGLSLFVVIALFATQSISTIFINKRKVEVTQAVRQEADYALEVMERHFRNATSITNCSATLIDYLDFYGQPGRFNCQMTPADDAYIASNGARLTTSAVNVSACQFSCNSSLNVVNISFTLTQSGTTTDAREKATANVSSQVQLRNK
ncbi:prepilin-type N-terminal cleavage/methylation domain-containing protein [Candidatus Microgenomates bacterium]|nr:prepilin-type N-terminal cleavage/methylation domain-containing protein [Candidatus Microgenomates bacterium]